MRTSSLIVVGLLATVSLLAVSTAANAENVNVGDCQKFSGLCAGACVDGTTDGCHDPQHQLCVGVSYQVPQCVNKLT